MTEERTVQRVLVTGATGFVGRNVVRELLARGLTPVCLVRTPGKLFAQHPEVGQDRFAVMTGSLSDRGTLRSAAEQSDAIIHLVGIIIARRLQGQTFEGIHVRGTRNVVVAAREAGLTRYIHMSALGAREDAASEYHRTKWEAEESVRQSGLEWTIFRPSLIHGPDGEFMSLMKRFICGLVPPVIPYFGKGQAKLQPVFVKDVAHCFVEALFRPETVGKTFDLGGPDAMSWVELYNTCRSLIPGARHWKPMVSQPVPVAKMLAALTAPPMAVAELFAPSLGLLRFDAGQVAMSQEDSVCDQTVAEQALGLRMRSFVDELRAYADRIR